MRQLARLYEALLGHGELDGHRVLSPQSVEAITARHRVGLYDETYHAQCDWGLGFAIDAFGMGRHTSPRAFGHGGALSAISFADPEHGLVAIVQTNGMCGNDDHYLRLDAITTALYEDLGLVPQRRARARQAVSVRRTHDHDATDPTKERGTTDGRQLDDDQGRGRRAPATSLRYAGQEFTVARVDSPFLGRDEMVCFIEDTADPVARVPRGAGRLTSRCRAPERPGFALPRDRAMMRPA